MGMRTAIWKRAMANQNEPAGQSPVYQSTLPGCDFGHTRITDAQRKKRSFRLWRKHAELCKTQRAASEKRKVLTDEWVVKKKEAIAKRRQKDEERRNGEKPSSARRSRRRARSKEGGARREASSSASGGEDVATTSVTPPSSRRGRLASGTDEQEAAERPASKSSARATGNVPKPALPQLTMAPQPPEGGLLPVLPVSTSPQSSGAHFLSTESGSSTKRSVMTVDGQKSGILHARYSELASIYTNWRLICHP